MNKVILLLCVLSVGCVNSNHRKSTKLNSPPSRETQNGRTKTAVVAKGVISEDMLQDQRDRNLLMKRKNELSQGQGNTQVNPPSTNKRGALPVAPQGILTASHFSEKQLFADLFSRFEKSDEIGFKIRLEEFLKKYPQSARADEALYMAGLMAVASHDYGMALKHLNSVLQKYPFSNKTSAALFAKGAVFKKMDLVPLSKEVFEQVVALYPGSPEADRAKVEMRLLK